MQVIYTKIINIELLTFLQAMLKECWNYVNNNVNNFFLKKNFAVSEKVPTFVVAKAKESSFRFDGEIAQLVRASDS